MTSGAGWTVLLLFILLSAGCASRGTETLLAGLGAEAVPIHFGPGDYEPLLQASTNARFILLGESTHGTHEFYEERARLTRELILRRGFNAVVLEANWSDAEALDRFIAGGDDASTAEGALAVFGRFPAWMWRNRELASFLEWLREHNESVNPEERVRLYGMDLYAIDDSLEAVPRLLERVDPAIAQRARERYRCLERFSDDLAAYGSAVASGRTRSCEELVEQQFEELLDLQKRSSSSEISIDLLFSIEQHARVVRNGERYYREAARGRVSSWNIRDRHMIEVLHALDRRDDQAGAILRVAVWAHNSHIGDARATDMSRRRGEWNIGQLIRETRPGESFLVGFSTSRGTVYAASRWGGEGRVRRLNEPLRGSVSWLLDQLETPALLLMMSDPEVATLLERPRPMRAIGVIYLPEQEYTAHYMQTHLAEQFDALVHIEETRALQPLQKGRAGVQESRRSSSYEGSPWRTLRSGSARR